MCINDLCICRCSRTILMMRQFWRRVAAATIAIVGSGGISIGQAQPTSNSNPPEKLSAADEVRITDISRAVQTNRPLSIARPFVQGEIHDFAQAAINGAPLPTQCDVKNRWPDGSLKFEL